MQQIENFKDSEMFQRNGNPEISLTETERNRLRYYGIQRPARRAAGGDGDAYRTMRV